MGTISKLRAALGGLAAVAILIMSAAALAQAPKEPIEIGVLNALTGPHEGEKENRARVVKFQLRPDPLAK